MFFLKKKQCQRLLQLDINILHLQNRKEEKIVFLFRY